MKTIIRYEGDGHLSGLAFSLHNNNNSNKKRRRSPHRTTKTTNKSSSMFLEFTKTEWREMNPKLQSLLLPWALLACVAIGSTFVNTTTTSYLHQTHHHHYSDEEYLLVAPPTTTAAAAAAAAEYSNSLAPLLERLLTTTTTRTTTDNSMTPSDILLLLDREEEGSDLHNNYHQNHRQLKHHHHPPLFPLSQSDYWGFFLATLGLMVAAGGGIGGGGILVPIFSLVHGFSAKHAIPLSNVTVFGGAVANTILNARKRHPFADRPLVDWDLILVMEPLTIAGALIGAFLNKLLPEAILTVMLVVLLSFTAYTSLKKAIKMYKIESKHLREQGIRQDGTKESELTKLAHHQHDEEDLDASERLLDDAEMQDSDDIERHPTSAEDGGGADSSKPQAIATISPANTRGREEGEGTISVEEDLLETTASKKAKLEAILEAERHVPMTNIHILVGMFVVVLAINLLKGGGAFPSPIGIVCGSPSFWIANGVVLLWIVVISLFVRAYLVNQYNIKQRVGYAYVEGDIKWDSRATIVYPCVCCLAGFFAGMFGVGGGIVKGPLMLAMGVHPAVSSASSACMILFTSFTATTSFIVFGLLVEDYAIVCFLLGFVATLVGQVGLSYLMRKSQRNSYIAFSIGGVVLLSAFLMTIQSLLSAAAGENEKSGGICGTS